MEAARFRCFPSLRESGTEVPRMRLFRGLAGYKMHTMRDRCENGVDAFFPRESDGDIISSRAERIVVPTVLAMKRRERKNAVTKRNAGREMPGAIRELVAEVAPDQPPYVVLSVDPLDSESTERLSALA